MFNLRCIFLFTVFLPERGIAGIQRLRTIISHSGPKGAKRENSAKKRQQKNKTLRELSFRHAFYLVRVVRVADISVTWLVYLACLRSHLLRSNCNFESKRAILITLFGRRPNKKMYVNINWWWRPNTQSAASIKWRLLRMLTCEMMRSKAPPSWGMYSYTVTCFSPSWPPFSFYVGPVDPRVENLGKNTTSWLNFGSKMNK